MKLIRSKTAIRKDIKYIRNQLAHAERLLRQSDVDWGYLVSLFAEVSGVAGGIENDCNDNATGIEDSYCK